MARVRDAAPPTPAKHDVIRFPEDAQRSVPTANIGGAIQAAKETSTQDALSAIVSSKGAATPDQFEVCLCMSMCVCLSCLQSLVTSRFYFRTLRQKTT
jgi:hypothetical protein